VTRAVPADPILPDPAMVRHDDQLLADTQSAILDGLGFGRSIATPTELRDMTAGVLDGIGGITGMTNSVEVPALAAVIISGISSRTDDATLDTIVNEAFAKGELNVPAALMTTEGAVDTASLLASILTGAKQRMGQPLPAPVTQIATYTVAAGDSLASIAALLYGDVLAYPKLLEANDDIMASPAQIATGMQLVVPPLQ
jgi:nucleoid-associated protein YgaU